MIKILIADDHILIREGLGKILDREMDIELAGEATDAAGVFDFLQNGSADIIVLDISLPDRNGLDVLKEIRNLYPEQKVLILSMYPEDRFAVRALKAGAKGYITKESAAGELVGAIRKVHSGRKYVSETLAEQLALTIDNDSDKMPHEKLSDREFQVFCMLGQGMSTHDVADKLTISISTVNTYRIRILNKISVKSNAELIHYAVQNNLVD